MQGQQNAKYGGTNLTNTIIIQSAPETTIPIPKSSKNYIKFA